MIQRIKNIFWPPKWKAALAAIFSLGLAVLLFSSPTLAPIGVSALMYGLWYSGVWLYKFSRDKRLADQAQAQVQATRPSQPVLPTRASNESKALFVPPKHPGER